MKIRFQGWTGKALFTRILRFFFFAKVYAFDRKKHITMFWTFKLDNLIDLLIKSILILPKLAISTSSNISQSKSRQGLQEDTIYKLKDNV